MTASEPLGTAAQEAARLVESLHGWWRESEPGRPGEQAPPLADDALAAGHASGEHAPSGACRYCPWCRAVTAAQHVRPEVVQHLLAGVESFAAALRELSRPAPSEGADDAAGRPPSGRPQQPARGPRTVTIPVEPDGERRDVRRDQRPDQHAAGRAADEEDH